jgi:hypothetical protein
MATNLEIIADSLREIGVIAETENPSAEQGAHVLRVMNDLIEAWTESDVEFGYFAQTETTDDWPGPEWAKRAVKLKLAIEIAPNYGAVVSPELATKALEAWNALVRKSIIEKMAPADMSHMPLGTGWGNGYDIETGS